MSISNTVTYGSTNTGQVTFPYVTMSVNTQVLYADDNMSQVGTRTISSSTGLSLHRANPISIRR